MLAALSSYFYPWQMPIIVVFMVGWLLASSYLLTRGLRKHLDVKRVKFGRSVLVILFSGAAAVMAGGVVYMLFQAIGQRMETSLLVPSAILAAVIAISMAYMVICAMSPLPVGRSLVVASLPMGATALLAILAGVACFVPAYIQRQKDLRDMRSRECLARIYEASRLYASWNLNRPASNLQVLVDAGYIKEKDLASPLRPDEGVGYFYYPRRVPMPEGESPQMLACDLRRNYEGRGRNVIFNNGEFRWMTEEEFQRNLTVRQNADFAEALRALDKD